MAARLPATARITATDLNQPMLDLAVTLSPNDPRITFSPCDATSLPFPHASFDAVICQFGVMFFPDRPMAFAQGRSRAAQRWHLPVQRLGPDRCQ